MADLQDVRTRFLQSSARMIFLASPSTSRHLSYQSSELEHTRSHGTTSRAARTVCEACGTLLLPGWTASTRFGTQRTTTTSQATVDEKIRRKTVSLKCSACHRVTKQTAEIKPNARGSRRLKPPVRGQKRLQPSVPGDQEKETVHDELSTDNSADKSTKLSSKKRAKARKDRQGLQALLNKSAQNRSRPTLNLMDLMKRP
ncbi:hypothetical protein A1O1_02506 [Capronia coronata CBS 617.96]|uniref:Uncharacterized protein n=1 Tax=Capronia coronata CBS 617.96 TaxID=1182541 RepID=W9YNI3_9EURO|nr:uncharacterized protein A1O1_02506 [Capronia coronata CBS 617.96]EXJ94113.1 hypothetical protein A1O1_02506 [Capronia coronata CBS 617.96]